MDYMKQIQAMYMLANPILLPKRNDTLEQRGEESRNNMKNMNKY